MPPIPSLSPELALLAACDLATDDALLRTAEAEAPRLDWARFANLAAAHAMSAVAGDRLMALAPGLAPADIAQDLRRALRDNTVAMLAQTVETASLCALLYDRGIRSIVLKGVALAHLLYPGHPEWRRSSDIDVLVDRADFLHADSTLLKAGYRRVWPEGELPQRGLDMLLHLANVFTYLSPATGLPIELHHRISLNPGWMPASFNTLHDRTTPVETDQGPVRCLDGAAHVSYLAWHALGHAGYRLKWFCDILRALRRAEVPTCMQLLDGDPIQTSDRPLVIVDRVIGAIAAAVGERSQLPVGTYGVEAAKRICDDMEAPAGIPQSRSLAALSAELANLRFLLEISPPGAARRYALLRTVSDPRDAYSLGLTSRFAPLYAAAGPLLALARWAARNSRPPAP